MAETTSDTQEKFSRDLSALQQEIADESAASDIECLLDCAEFDEHMIGFWYDVERPGEGVDRQWTDKAVVYLELRGRLIRHPAHRNLVRPIYPERS